MALFKIFKGNSSTLPKNYKDGYCYFTVDDGKMYIAIKTDDNPDDSVTLYGIDKLDMEFFKKWNDKFDFHCYGLVVESKPGEWKIIED